VIERLRAHYGLGRTPFGRDLAPGMLHQHRGHAEAVARIAWLISERAIGVVTGEVGAGKTVAARAAVAKLDPVRHTIVYLPNPCIGQRGLYAEIVRHLGGHPRFHKASLVAQAAELLVAEDTEKAKTTVVLIDEAHLLSGEQLEEVRMLTNHAMDLLTVLPEETSQVRGHIQARGVMVPGHDQTRGVWPGPGDGGSALGGLAAGDRRSVGTLPAG
jgi:type II secretory pathway predicted ATPase ExeA